MSALPPRDELARVARALAVALPGSFATVLADTRWADVAAALDRLAVPGAAHAAATDVPEAEAARLAALLVERWGVLEQWLGEVALEPAAAVRGPSRAVVGEPVTLDVVVDGLADGWLVAWTDGVSAQGRAAVLRATEPGTARVSARVLGRTGAGRVVLVADHVVRVERSGGPEEGGDG
jgi:hypothetical protein